eukprot:CAMPEP_0197436154 /NCGR_PEP_ID=MMETSP1175-20131217/3621_1 /TAXON_ID=1003142 /ORGANISM="Triceratium dubium, Strain CCMP147" /LENGTH=237 /DNA_ID=CAMNT_0042965373 /DNA_START=164 /DNA_END=877 /DNA_ORIENTATION=-
MSKSYFTLLSLCLTASTYAFTSNPSSFTGRASSVCSRAELTTELSCPPITSDLGGVRRGTGMSMPPFLKKLGLKKPEKPLFGGEEEGSGSSEQAVAVLEKQEEKPDKLANGAIDEECVLPEDVKELSETEKLLKQVKEAGTAGVISYALWELAFWTISVPVCIVGYRELTGHWPDLRDKEDLEKVGAEAFAFVNFARFAVPLRIGLALSTTPWIQENIVDKFMKKDEPPMCEPEDEL